VHDDRMNAVLVNIAHGELPCKSHNNLPALRIMGCFASADHAQNHLKKILKRKLVEPLPFFVIETFCNFVIPSTTERSAEYLEQKARDLYEMQEQHNQTETKAFQKRVKAKEKNTTEEYNQMMKEKEDRDQSKASFLRESLEESDSFVYRDAEVRGQSYAAIGFINDPDKSKNEPLVCIYGAFESEDTCVRYIEDSLSDEIDNITLYCVEMYSWLYPTLVENKGLMEDVPKSYRHSDLNAWMNAKSENDKMVKEFYKNSKKQTDALLVELEADEEVSKEEVPSGAVESKA
tara:strand:+ start:1280 stop:2149 length:870 start_codon:yes stop_codon:yes gene_type:complete